MILQVGGVKLDEWRGETFYVNDKIRHRWFRTDKGFLVVIIGAYQKQSIDEWQISFHWKLKYLNDIMPNKDIIGTAEEVKQQVDDFLIRMSKLTAFI